MDYDSLFPLLPAWHHSSSLWLASRAQDEAIHHIKTMRHNNNSKEGSNIGKQIGRMDWQDAEEHKVNFSLIRKVIQSYEINLIWTRMIHLLLLL